MEGGRLEAWWETACSVRAGNIPRQNNMYPISVHYSQAPELWSYQPENQEKKRTRAQLLRKPPPSPKEI